MKFKVNTKLAVQSESSGAGSAYINRTGVYDATIKFASISTSANGSHSLNFNLELPTGETQTIYGPRLTKNDGTPLDIGMGLFTSLCVIAGLSDGDEPTYVEETHKVGKDNKNQEFLVIEEMSGLPIKLRVQRTFTKWEGNIKANPEIKSFFREDGASAREIVEGTEVGVRLAYETEKFTQDSYRDDITPEEAEAWLKEQAEARKGTGAKSTPKPTVKKVANPFG